MTHKELYFLCMFLSTTIIYSLNAKSETEPILIKNYSGAYRDLSIQQVQQNTSACSTICLICNNNSNPQTCSQCLPGYVVLTSGSCVACPNGCSLCEGT